LTLVELLAVVVILAIIGTIAFVMIGNVIENSKKDAHISNAQQLISAAKLHDAQNGEFNEEGVVSSEELQSAGVLDRLIDPWDILDEESYTGSVTKNEVSTGVEYEVTLASPDGKCTPGINGTEESDLFGDDARKDICG